MILPIKGVAPFDNKEKQLTQIGTWGTVTTLKENVDIVKRFVAHHKSLGARVMYLYFDDPADPAIEVVRPIEGVIIVKCDENYWKGRRPDAHQKRQKINANAAYKSSSVDWLIHLDADELLYCKTPISAELDEVPKAQNVIRVSVAEAFSGTQGGKHIFRFALPKNDRGQKLGLMIYGEEYPLLVRGLLSHTDGKYFVRSSSEAMNLTIHAPFVNGKRNHGTTSKSISLLHFHGDNEENWIRSVRRRLDSGAYQKKFIDDRRAAGKVEGMARNEYLNYIINTQGEDGLRQFYRRICTFDKSKRPLRRANALLKLDLWIPNKIETYFPGSHKVSTQYVRVNNSTSRLEAGVLFRGIKMIVSPEDNYTEKMLTSGREVETEELNIIQKLVSGRNVGFLDMGAKVGVYSLLTSKYASEGSEVLAFESIPAMANKLQRNIALNSMENIMVHRVTLGENKEKETGGRHPTSGLVDELGGALKHPDTLEVQMCALNSFMEKQVAERLTILRVGIEFAEPGPLFAFVESVLRTAWPEYILCNHADTDISSRNPEKLFSLTQYTVEAKFKNNTLLRRCNY